MNPLSPISEITRLQALQRYRILDTPPAPAFDDLTQLAIQICGTPMALISLVDQERLWLKSKVGLPLSELPRAGSFCDTAILQPEVFVVPDALADHRFATFPLVVQPPQIRFYAAAPLVTPDGFALGTVCVLDTLPRALTSAQLESLQILSRQVMAQLELQRQLAVLSATVAQQQRIEAKLQLFEAIVEQIDDSVIVTTTELDLPGPQIVYANPAFTTMMGYGLEEVQGKTPRMFQGPLTDRTMLSQLRQHLQRGEGFQGENINYRKNGTPFTLEWRITPIRDRQQQLTYFVAVQRDITERKQAEADLKIANDQLEQRVAERTLELARANAELQAEIAERQWAVDEMRRMWKQEKEIGELKSRFISIASHEFRTPLSTILFSAGLLEKYGDQWPPLRTQEHLQRIQTAVHNMTQMLNDVLLIGKAEAAKLEFDPALIDLKIFCQELVEEMQLSTDSRHQLALNYQVQAPTVCMDEKLLQHIFRNLLSNAIKYSPEGGIVSFEVVGQQQEVIFQVKDQGIGILPADQQRLFESFYRGKNVGGIAGTGLGLTIVKNCVELHQGHISFTSQADVGTTFWVRLPCNGSSQG